MKLVKFVKITEENKDEVAQELGWEDESALLKDAEFDTMVGLWADVDADVESRSVFGTFTRVHTISVESRLGARPSTTVFAIEADLLVVDPGVALMPLEQFENTFC